MAAPAKEGLTYFPCHISTDDAMSWIESRFGTEGYGIMIKLYGKIYGTHGYYCEWSDKIEMLFACRECTLDNTKDADGSIRSVKRLREILDEALEWGIFSREMFDKHGILTSALIQHTYFDAIKRRKQTDVREEYLLIDLGNTDASSQNVDTSEHDGNVSEQDVNVSSQDDKLPEPEVNTALQDENIPQHDVCIMQHDVYNNEQSKVKQSKVKQIKANEIKAEVAESKANKIKANEIKAEVVESKENKSNADKTAAYLPPLPPLKKTSVPDALIAEYGRCIGNPGSLITGELAVWLERVDAEVIIYAIHEADMNGVRKWSYVRSVLENHYRAGRTSMKAIEADNASRKRRRMTDRDTSIYKHDDTDYDEIMRLMNERY